MHTYICIYMREVSYQKDQSKVYNVYIAMTRVSYLAFETNGDRHRRRRRRRRVSMETLSAIRALVGPTRACRHPDKRLTLAHILAPSRSLTISLTHRPTHYNTYIYFSFFFFPFYLYIFPLSYIHVYIFMYLHRPLVYDRLSSLVLYTTLVKRPRRLLPFI